MSNQESLFADQEQEPEPRQSHMYQGVDPRDQHQPGREQWHRSPSSGEYHEGYAAHTTDPAEQERQPFSEETYTETGTHQWNAGKIYPQSQRPKRRGVRWGWIVVAVLVFLFAFGGMISYTVNSVVHSIPHSIPAPMVGSVPQVFSVGAHPVLNINVGSASVHIHAGPDNSVSVTTSTSRDQLVNSFQQNDVINVQEQGRVDFRNRDRSANIDITAPVTTDIQLNTTAGSVEINGINGQVNASTSFGKIDVTQTTLRGQSSLHVGTGSVRFEGSLDSAGSYRMDTDVGAVDVNLPPDASFNLNGNTNISNDFGSTTVGNAPQPSLDLHSGLGKVSIHKNGA
jgi:hypothetical protein